MKFIFHRAVSVGWGMTQRFLKVRGFVGFDNPTYDVAEISNQTSRSPDVASRSPHVATVFFTPSGKNTKTQIKPFGYRFRQSNHASGHSIPSAVCAYMP